MANKITYGLRNVHIAFRLADDSSGEPVWDTPDAIDGAVRFTPTAEGDEFKFYADDALWFGQTVNNGYTAELEIANLSDAILAEMLGWDIDDNSAIVESADATSAAFALMFETQGDDKPSRHVFYNCLASRPEREEKTKSASIEPGTDVLKLVISAVEIDSVLTVRSKLTQTTENTSTYTAFFDDVYVPELGSA